MTVCRGNFLIFIFFIISSTATATKDYELLFDDIQCIIVNNDYVENQHCSVDKSGNTPLLNVDVQMKKEVQESFYDFIVNVLPTRTKPMTLLKAEGVNYCALQTREAIVPVFQILTNLLKTSGELPQTCPIPANFHYYFRNLSVNSDFLPSYSSVRKMGLKVFLAYYNRKTRYLTITIEGKIILKKLRNKSRKKI